MKKCAILLGFLCLSACDRPSIFAPAEAKTAIGRWSIAPISGAAHDKDGHMVAYAWRTDSVTGTVEMCTYSEFPVYESKGEREDPTTLYCGRGQQAVVRPAQ